MTQVHPPPATNTPTPTPTNTPGGPPPTQPPPTPTDPGQVGIGGTPSNPVTLTTILGNPTYIWNPVSGATSYTIYLASTNNLFHALFYDVLPGATYCNANLCAVDLTTLAATAWLGNGNYTIYFLPSGGDWQGPFDFTVDVPKPVPVTPQGFTDTLGSAVALQWSLDGNADYAGWFRVYAAPENDVFNPILDNWYSREDVLCADDTNCTLQLSQLQPGVIYVAYIQSWGPGGMTNDGGVGNTGWAGPLRFALGGQLPSQPQNISAVLNGTEVTLTWDDDPAATRYWVFIGDLDQLDSESNYFLEFRVKTDANLTCNGTTCTTVVDLAGKPSGTYSSYIQARNAGDVESDWGIGGNTISLP